MKYKTPSRNIFMIAGLILGVLCLTIARPAPIQAQTDVTMSINPATTQVEVGDTFTVDVVVDAGTQPINAAQALVEFDPAVLQVQSVTAGTTLMLKTSPHWAVMAKIGAMSSASKIEMT